MSLARVREEERDGLNNDIETLDQAQRILSSRRLGFDGSVIDQVIGEIKEEIAEIEFTLSAGDS